MRDPPKPKVTNLDDALNVFDEMLQRRPPFHSNLDSSFQLSAASHQGTDQFVTVNSGLGESSGSLSASKWRTSIIWYENNILINLLRSRKNQILNLD
jgi:hypothetical protein